MHNAQLIPLTPRTADAAMEDLIHRLQDHLGAEITVLYTTPHISEILEDRGVLLPEDLDRELACIRFCQEGGQSGEAGVPLRQDRMVKTYFLNGQEMRVVGVRVQKKPVYTNPNMMYSSAMGGIRTLQLL